MNKYLLISLRGLCLALSFLLALWLILGVFIDGPEMPEIFTSVVGLSVLGAMAAGSILFFFLARTFKKIIESSEGT